MHALKLNVDYLPDGANPIYQVGHRWPHKVLTVHKNGIDIISTPLVREYEVHIPMFGITSNHRKDSIAKVVNITKKMCRICDFAGIAIISVKTDFEGTLDGKFMHFFDLGIMFTQNWYDGEFDNKGKFPNSVSMEDTGVKDEDLWNNVLVGNVLSS